MTKSERRTVDAGAWIERLGLAPHPEGGWFRETYRAALRLPAAALEGYGGARAASTAIYFLLEGDQTSAFHRLRSDEVWHHHAGSSLTLHLLEEGLGYRSLHLGGAARGETWPQAVVPGGVWFGATVDAADGYALVGCTVAPGFDFADFEMARREELLDRFPQHRGIVERLTAD